LKIEIGFRWEGKMLQVLFRDVFFKCLNGFRWKTLTFSVRLVFYQHVASHSERR
jgi:hypothetical protein